MDFAGAQKQEIAVPLERSDGCACVSGRTPLAAVPQESPESVSRRSLRLTWLQRWAGTMRSFSHIKRLPAVSTLRALALRALALWRDTRRAQTFWSNSGLHSSHEEQCR